MVATKKQTHTRQPSLVRKPSKFTVTTKPTRRLSYPAAKKASDKYKNQCNALIGELAADCASAVVLDTSFFKTVQSILRGSKYIKRIFCPQMDKVDFNRMKRGLRYRKFKGKEKVTLMYSSMGEVIDTELAPLFDPKSKVLVWHDAMSTWRAETHCNTSIKSDVMNILRTFKQSHAHSMVLAVTICTRSKQTGNEIRIGGNRVIISSDIINMAFDQGVRIRLIDEFAYPQMFFIVMEVSHLGAPHLGAPPAVFTSPPMASMSKKEEVIDEEDVRGGVQLSQAVVKAVDGDVVVQRIHARGLLGGDAGAEPSTAAVSSSGGTVTMTTTTTTTTMADDER